MLPCCCLHFLFHLNPTFRPPRVPQVICKMIEQNQCVGNHIHDVIQGSYRPQGLMRMPVTRYTELYTAAFGRKLSRAILCSIRNGEQGPQVEIGELCTVATTVEENPPKRRRLGQKTPEALAQNPDQRTVLKKGLIECLSEAEQVTPRVGKVTITDGLLFDMIQRCFLEKEIVVMDCCRGIDRRRVPPVNLSKGVAPYRFAFGKKRSDRELFLDDQWELWEQISRRK